ncbi:hypothetical protein HYC85_009442 [Camellia sinensis]|uniref:Oxidoreductase molybdopterin-binding domain-containing protein n=1 Tax=Camellia sinensis TaxID=4442 RepID=A0A7J7HHM4_CAMSI|nr:hypothetical protein HYC85_009442 [Camellia sinensis]
MCEVFLKDMIFESQRIPTSSRTSASLAPPKLVFVNLGTPKLMKTTPLGGKHVEFVSVDMCKEEKGGPYKASIPLIQSTNSEADVLLAYEMNGELLNRDHGYPLRVVVPGVTGARSVKWLDSINIIGEECQGFFMQRDYKMFPPSVNWENIDWSTRKPQMDFPVQSAICSLEDDNTVQHGKAKFMAMQCLEVDAALKDLMYHSMVARHGWKHPDTKRVEFHIMLLLMMINTVTNGHGCCLKLKVMSSTIQRLLPKL